MNDTLVNLLALVAEGRLSRAQAKGAAASAWLTGAVHVDELPVFAINLQEVWEEAEDQKYAERKAKEMRDTWMSQWPEIKVWLEPRPTPPVNTFSIPRSGRQGWYVNGSPTPPFIYDAETLHYTKHDLSATLDAMGLMTKPARAARKKKIPTRAAKRSSSRTSSKAAGPKSR